MQRPTLRVRRYGALFAILSLCATGCASPTSTRAPTPERSELRRVPLGLCEDYPEESRSLAAARRDLELLRAAGLRVLRVSLGWDAIEPEKDRYDLTFWDAFVDMAVREFGVTLVPYVAYTPRWNSDGSPEDFWKTPPRDAAEFGQIVRLLAERYRGRIHAWELWNEPDNRDYWTGTVGDYATLLRAGAEAVRAGNPDAAVVSGGLAGTVAFLEQLFDDWDAASLVDVVNLHAYYETWNPEPLETIPEYVAQVSDIVARHGGRQAIWMAEVGYGNFRRGAHVSADVTATFAYEHTLAFQAVALVRTHALVLSTPVELVAWYELKDPPASDAMIGDVNNRHLGVAFTDYRPKPALAALSFVNRLFSPGFRNVDAELRVERQPGSDAEVHGFWTGRRSLLLFAWLRTRSARPPPASERGDAHDDRRESLQVLAPYPLTGEAKSYDELGRVRPSSTHIAATRDATAITLELRGGEIQILELPVRRD